MHNMWQSSVLLAHALGGRGSLILYIVCRAIANSAKMATGPMSLNGGANYGTATQGNIIWW